MNPMEPEITAEIVEVSGDSTAIDSITRAEIDMAITTAKRYPRDLRRFTDDVVSMATIDQETAEGCFYSLRRKGKTIQGPSVRLAEIAVSAWGNIRAGARILGPTEDGRFIKAMGVCHDLEKNVYIAIESQRRITTKTGQAYGDDMIGVTGNAAAAIGFRNAVLKVIPKGMLQKAYRQCVEVATGGAKTLTERREQVFERLRGLNPMITDDRILASLDKPSIDNVTLDDVTHLIGLGTAIRDGAQTVDEAFPEPSEISPEDITGTIEPETKEKPNPPKPRKLSGPKVKAIEKRISENHVMLPSDLRIEIKEEFGESVQNLRTDQEDELDKYLEGLGV